MSTPRTISADEYIRLVNLEGHPDLEAYKQEVLSFDGQYAVHIHSGYGSFLSPLISKDKLKETEKAMVAKHEELKQAGKPVQGIKSF